jgi:hypothetical protein
MSDGLDVVFNGACFKNKLLFPLKVYVKIRINFSFILDHLVLGTNNFIFLFSYLYCFSFNVIASNAYIHPVYGGIPTTTL